MKRQMNLGLLGSFRVLAIASAMGCEAQVTDDYTGEPLLSLRGNVIVRADLAGSDLVPRIGFVVPEYEANSVILIDGEVSGEFPAKFRFDVTRPPPEEVLSLPSSYFGFDSKLAFGYLVLRPPSSASRIPNNLGGEYIGDGCTADGLCTHREIECDDAGHCRERTLECTQHPCELVDQWGDSALGETTESPSDWSCDSERCLAVDSACDAELKCRTDAYSCDFAQQGEFDSFDSGIMTTCRVTSDTGDTSLVGFSDLRTVALGYAIVYVADDDPNSIYGPLDRGYNLLRVSSSQEGFLEARKCEDDALTKAVAEYNEEHGTQYSPLGGEPELSDLRSEAFAQCAPSVEVVERPLAEVLTIELGKPQAF